VWEEECFIFPILIAPGREDIFESAPSTSQKETQVKRVRDNDVEKSEDVDDYYDVFDETKVRRFGREQSSEIASPYLTPYVYNRRFLYKQYGLREEKGNFKIGDSLVSLDVDSNVHIKGHIFKRTEGLWELLTRKRVDSEKITKPDLKAYNAILEMNYGHLEIYEPTGNIQISRGPRFRDIISEQFP
jgi:hypothetical protein